MNTDQIRDQSVRMARDLGIKIPDSLPILDDLELRGEKEIVSRILAMHAVVAVAFSFERVKALEWLNREGVTESLTTSERQFIFESLGSTNSFQIQIEGMWALAWVLQIVEELDFKKYCSDKFINVFPDLKLNQTSADFRKKARLRSQAEIIAACDLAYCLHWAIRQAEITNKPPPLELRGYAVVERRRALEWVLSAETWDEVSLDT